MDLVNRWRLNYINIREKKEIIDNINIEGEENEIKLTEEENNILNQIRIFRNNPKSLLNKKDLIKNKNKKTQYEEFINSLKKMPELNLDKKLIEIAKEEIKILSNDLDNYEKIQIGESVKSEIKEKLSDKDIALLIINDIDKIEDFVYKIIMNDVDKEKKGRVIISDKTYTYIGLSQYCSPENDDEKPVILIFAKDKIGKKLIPELGITNKDNNSPTKINKIRKKDEKNEILDMEKVELQNNSSKKFKIRCLIFIFLLL